MADADKRPVPPSGGVSLREAVEKFTNPELLQSWKDALAALEAAGAARGCQSGEIDPGVASFLTSPLSWSEWNTRRRSRPPSPVEKLRSAERQLVQALYADLRQRLLAGELSAWARNGDPITNYQQIPADAWRVLRVKSWSNSIAITRERRCLYDVTVCRHATPGLASAETSCERWLRRLREEGPKDRSRPEYEKEAMERFPGLSAKGFGRAWRAAHAGTDWARPGAPRKRASGEN